jgi:hypothetical protein
MDALLMGDMKTKSGNTNIFCAFITPSFISLSPVCLGYDTPVSARAPDLISIALWIYRTEINSTLFS